MELAEVAGHAVRLGPVAHLATVRPDGRPHGVPVAVTWVDDHLAVFVRADSVKVANVRNDPRVHLHWQVGAGTNHDSLIVEGVAWVIESAEGRRRLWGRMGQDLFRVEPKGPAADDHVFLWIQPVAATLLVRYGNDGRDSWRADPDDIVFDLRDVVLPDRRVESTD
jgi:nitroimidazol reductase NimA-like FMN-containing flavoprotein (pyridoxamine 5'-phosphate oxidase superfamily)